MTGVADHARGLVRLELELALAELRDRLRHLQVGVALLGGALAAAALAAGTGVAAVAALLALVLPWWAALLIVTAGLLGLAAVLGLSGATLLRENARPVPEAAIEEARMTLDELSRTG